MKNTKFTKTLLALSISAVLTACGGSSSSDDPVDNTIDATLSGTAAKGIIIGGLVTANELNSSGSVLRVVGTATTDATGKYSLELEANYEGGPIQIVVTKNTTTTMVCDVADGCGPRTDDLTDSDSIIDFGEQYKPGSLEMTAMLPDAEDGETINVQVTPFTHMAATRALAATTLDASAISNANSEVSSLLGGIDILTTEPVDITDPDSVNDATPGAVAYAALGASIAALADPDADGQPDIASALNSLATNFADGTVSATGDDFSLQEIITAAEDTLDEVGAADTSGVLVALQSDVDDAGEGGTIDPEASENAGDSDVEKAKAFLVDLRTWGVTIGDQLDAPADAFSQQVDMADEAAYILDEDGASEAIGWGIMAIVQKFDGNIVNLTDMFTEDEGDNPFTAGTLTSTTTTNGLQYTIAGAELIADGEDVELDMTLIIPADGQTGDVITFGIVSIESETDTTRLVVNSGQISVTLEDSYTINFDQLEAGTAPDPSPVEAIEFDFDFAATRKITLNASGVLVAATDPLTIAASLEANLYPYNDANGEILDVIPGSFSMTGTFSNTTGDSFDMNVSASIPGAATLVPVSGMFDLDSTYDENNNPTSDGDHLISWTITGGDTFNYNHPYSSFSATFNVNGSVTLTQVGGDPYTYTGPYASAEAFFAENYWLLDDYYCCFWVDGQGEYVRDYSIHDYTMDGFIAFTLDDADVEFFDDTQPLVGTAGVQFSVQFDGLPEAQISVEGNATGLDAGDANVTISYGTRQLEFIATTDLTSGDAVSLEITNQDSVKLILTGQNLNDGIDNNETANVTINGKVVATIVDMDNGTSKVTYIDGTFEIF